MNKYTLSLLTGLVFTISVLFESLRSFILIGVILSFWTLDEIINNK